MRLIIRVSDFLMVQSSLQMEELCGMLGVEMQDFLGPVALLSVKKIKLRNFGRLVRLTYARGGKWNFLSLAA
jgi:hypothetical protein